MKLAVVIVICFVAFGLVGAHAQSHKKTRPKNEVTKLEKARKTNHTVRQVTPDPKKSPGKHAVNLSKNVNHEVNRESKDFNHSLNRFSKDVNHAFQGKKKKAGK